MNATTVDGVPCFWADVPGPCQAGLLFRVGRADETLPTAGITLLVQRLAYADGAVDSVITSFQAEVERPAVAGFFEKVCRSLSALPLGGLATEKRVLSVEYEREDPGLPERMMMMRFGAVRHGLSFYEPMGARWLAPEDVADWARRWFTRGNAAVWMTCPPPPDLRLPLPDGGRAPAPDPVAIPGLQLPAFAAAGHGLTASTMVGRRSAPLTVAVRAVAERLRDADHPVASWQLPLTAELLPPLPGRRGRGRRAGAPEQALEARWPPTGRRARSLSRGGRLHRTRARAPCRRGARRPGADGRRGAARRAAAAARTNCCPRGGRQSPTRRPAAALREALGVADPAGPGGDGEAERALRRLPAGLHTTGSRAPELKPPLRPAAPVRLVCEPGGRPHVARDAGHASTDRSPTSPARCAGAHGSLTLVGHDGAIVPASTCACSRAPHRPGRRPGAERSRPS